MCAISSFKKPFPRLPRSFRTVWLTVQEFIDHQHDRWYGARLNLDLTALMTYASNRCWLAIWRSESPLISAQPVCQKMTAHLTSVRLAVLFCFHIAPCSSLGSRTSVFLCYSEHNLEEATTNFFLIRDCPQFVIVLQLIWPLHYMFVSNRFKTVVTGNSIHHFRVPSFSQLRTEDSVWLGFDAASTETRIPTFRRSVLPSSRVGRSYESH
jgi:hypothetical protein